MADLYRDRRHAGAVLGERLVAEAPTSPLVLALPRGGVPVGYEVAQALDCPLDVLLVRKVGVPQQPELAMGAVAEGEVVIRNESILRVAAVSEERFRSEVERARRELERRAVVLRDTRPPVVLEEGDTVLIVDDGLATGATAMAAVEAIRQRGAGQVWVCVPVAPPDTTREFEKIADRVVVLQQPRQFMAVGAWYRDFGQTDDEEVRALLAGSRLR